MKLSTSPLPPFEVRPVELLLVGAYVFNAALGTAALMRLFEWWMTLGPLLRRLGAHSIGRSFEVAPALVESVDQQLTRRYDAVTRMAVCVEVLRGALDNDTEQDRLAWHGVWSIRLRDLDRALQKARASRASLNGGRDLAPEVLGSEVAPLLIESARIAYRMLPQSPAPVRKELESFVASVLAILVNRLVRPARWFFLAAVNMAVLTLFGLSSYPLLPQSGVRLIAWVTVLTMSTVTFSIYVAMERNALLSRIAGTTPGKIEFNLDLYSRAFTLVVVPLLSLVATQFSQAVRLITALVAPIARILH